jgi:DNA-binding beta-propeller fold protein YncE
VGFYDTVPTGLHFKDDGTKIYINGQNSDRVSTITLATPWDVSTAILPHIKSFSVASQEISPSGLFFKDDGTKVYIIGTTNDRIYQYSLGTAWDITTASYENKSFLVQTQEATPGGLFFKDDGTKVYIVGSVNDTIYQYTLSTPWDISTASYDSKSFSVNQEGTPQEVFFKPDGTKVYVVGDTSDIIRQYTVATPWDLSTASFDNVSFAIGAQDAQPRGLYFKSDGTKVYMVGLNNSTIYSYTLSIPWDVSSAFYDSKFFQIDDNAIHGASFKPDGTKLYVIGQGTDRIYEYDLETPWVLTQNTNSLSILVQDTASTGVYVTDDLSKIYVVGSTNRALHQYDLFN